MRNSRRQPLVDDSNENFWPSFADLTSTVTLIFFVLMLLAYLQNLIAGRNLEAATRRLAESRRLIGDAEGRLRVLEGDLRTTSAEIEAGRSRLRSSEERVEASNRELASVRSRLQGIAVLRVDVLNKVKGSLEGELGAPAAGPARVAIADNGNIVINESLVFEYDSYTIKAEGKRLLATLAQAFARVLADAAVRENVDVILVQGHTDERGTSAYNRDLSAKRANAVLNYMFETNRTLESSYGGYFASSAYSEFRPVNPAKTEAAYEQNRRIEISVVLKDANVSGVIDEYMRSVATPSGGPGAGALGGAGGLPGR